jgi:predicted amidophosphoribosyltransferase
MIDFMCWYCGSPVKEPEPLGRSRVCPDCGKDLRSCRNCRHHLPSGCAEGQAEKPSDPERANFCDWFSLNPRFTKVTDGVKKSIDTAASARSAFDDLFK